MNDLRRFKLIKGLEIRKTQLVNILVRDEVKYKLTHMHHMRDIETVLAFLRGEEITDRLLDNLPTARDL